MYGIIIWHLFDIRAHVNLDEIFKKKMDNGYLPRVSEMI